MQPDLFAAAGGQANAWADVDNDGDLDYFVAFRGRPNRFYRNDKGTFRDVASEVGLADNVETRAAAWGDFDADGDPDLFIGFADPAIPAKVYRNDAKGTKFVDVARDDRRSTSPASRGSRRGSTTTATAISICLRPFAMSPIAC